MKLLVQNKRTEIEERTDNKGLKEMAGDEQVLIFVHLIYLCSGEQR